MSNTWFDIQLNDVNNSNNEFNTQSKVSESVNQLKCDSNNAYNESLNNNNNNINDNKTDIRSESPFLIRETISSSPSLSPNYSMSENQFDFDVGINVPNRGRIGSLVDELLNDIYCKLRSHRNRGYSISSDSSYSIPDLQKKPLLRDIYLKAKGIVELKQLSQHLGNDVNRMNSLLLHHLRKRDRLSSQRSQCYDIITAALQAISPKRSVDTKMRFSIEPYPGDSGFSQWHDAMRMVSRLPGGIPQEFRKKLWITLAERHIQTRKINWSITSRFCFNEKGNPDDEALGAQIVKDLHRTGCSLFSGEELHNQALLKQVLLAYARWNKSVGYCQGFNMLAAIMLEVMEGNVEDSLKVMIYLIEGVLPESYFANNLRGLSVDMAVFRDLLRMRLSALAKHFDQLQYEAQDSSTGASYEPPLINVFTMQWFLTLFSNCLPKSSVLRIWDLIFLEGNEVLLRAALAIWDCLADRILTVESADEFYSIMGVLTREMMEFGVTDTNELVKTICIMAPFPFPQLSDLREKYIYNIRPLTSSFALVKKGIQIFQSDDEEEADLADDQMMLANWCISNALNSNKTKDQNSGSRTPSPSLGNCIGSTAINVGNATTNFLSANNIDPQRMTLDISLLKKQYAKLKERQQQAQVILTEGFQHANSSPFSKKEPLTMNHLLMGKTALIAKRPKRPSPVLQSATRANFDPKKTLHGRSNTVANLFPHKKSNSINNNNNNSQRKEQKIIVTAHKESIELNTSETLSWSQIKLDKKREKFQRKLSEPVLSVFNESIAEDSSNGFCLNSNDNDVLLITDNNNPIPRNGSIECENSDDENNSESSSSTELCDTEHLDDSLSDFASEPDVSQRKTSIQFNQKNENKNSPNIRSNEASKESMSESANQCLTEDDNCCDKSRNSQLSEPQNSINTDNYIENEDNEDNDAYSSIKREISELSLEECIQKLNEKISSLNDININN